MAIASSIRVLFMRASYSGNPQLLSWLDLVGIAQDVAVGLEDLRIQASIAVEFLGDARQGVAFLHDIGLRVRIVGRRRRAPRPVLCNHERSPPLRALPAAGISQNASAKIIRTQGRS